MEEKEEEKEDNEGVEGTKKENHKKEEKDEQEEAKENKRKRKRDVNTRGEACKHVHTHYSVSLRFASTSVYYSCTYTCLLKAQGRETERGETDKETERGEKNW